MVGPVSLGYARIVLSSCSSHLRILLSPSHGGGLLGSSGQPLTGKLPPAAFAEGVVVVEKEKVATTRATTSSRIVASLCFTAPAFLQMRPCNLDWGNGRCARPPRWNGRPHGDWARTPRRESKGKRRGKANLLVSTQPGPLCALNDHGQVEREFHQLPLCRAGPSRAPPTGT